MALPSILVVDDNVLLAETLQELLVLITPDDTCLLVRTQAEALAALTRHAATIRLVLLDIGLPDVPLQDMQGIRTIVQATGAPVIVMTGGNDRWEAEAYQYGARHFFFKPDMRYASLEAVVRVLLPPLP